MAAVNVIDQQVGMRIRLRRIAMGLNVNQLAEMANSTAESIRQFESGIERPDASTFIRICRAMRVPASDFFKPLLHSDDLKVDGECAFAERRVHVRIKTEVRGIADVVGSLRPVRILDMSRGGVKLTKLTLDDVGKDLTLFLKEDLRKGTVVWANDKVGGVCFNDILPYSTLVTLAAV